MQLAIQNGDDLVEIYGTGIRQTWPAGLTEFGAGSASYLPA